MLWLIGIVIIWLIGYAMGKRSSNIGALQTDNRQQLRQELEALAENTADAGAARGIRMAAEHIDPQAPLAPIIASEKMAIPKPTVAATPLTPNEHEWRDLIPAAQQPYAKPTPGWTPPDLRNLDSVSILLYFGAFLMIAGVGLFVGLSDVSGAIKTTAVLVLALGLYAAGIYLYGRIEKLRPAAIAITAIGLICLPLTGVAAYTYLTSNTYGPAIWCLTSLACLGLYIVALWRIRQSFIGYLSVFMCLSLWLSIVAIVDAPVHFFGWAMVVLGMIYIVLGRFTKLWAELEAPLGASASIMVPTALAVTLLFGNGTIGMLDQGITLLLGTIFYGLATWIETKPRERLAYFTLALILLPLATVFIVHDVAQDRVITAFSLAAATIAELCGLALRRTTLPTDWLKNGLTVGALGLLTAAGVCLSAGNWMALSCLLAVTAAVHAVVGIMLRSKIHMAFGFIAALMLPWLFGFMAMDPDVPHGLIIATYIGMGLGIMAIRVRLAGLVSSYSPMAYLAYAVAFGIAWLIGSNGDTWLPMATSIAVGLAATIVAYYERQPGVVYVAAGLGVVATLQGLAWQHHTGGSDIAAALGTLGLAYYIVGKLQEWRPSLVLYGKPLTFAGIIALYCGPLFGQFTAGTAWGSIIYLGIAGALTSVEAYITKDKLGFYAGAGVVVAALELGLYHSGVREWQLYWYIWSAYWLAIAYRHKLPEAIYAATLLGSIGLAQGLAQHHAFALTTATLSFAALSVSYYTIGKLHGISADLHKLGAAWTNAGLAGLYCAAALAYFIPSNNTNSLPNALALITAGALSSYESYNRRSRSGLYLSGAIVLIGLQWLMYLQDVREIQLYTHLWAAYFTCLAWLSHRSNRPSDKQSFTILALMLQTVPLAWQGLQGETGYGLLLMLESIGIMLLGLAIKYPLVMRWGLVVAVGSVLYQLRDLQFALLVLLGAGIIGLSVYLLLRKTKH